MRRSLPRFIHGLYALLALSCRASSDHDAPGQSWPLETAIARDLTARFGEPATARCDWFGVVPACSAQVLGTRLPIRVSSDGRAWIWHVDGRYVDTRPIAKYVDSELAEIHVKQTVSCGAALQRVDARLPCELSGGGKAFVDIGSGGTLSLELEIDRAAADARGEAETPERARELEQKSRALEKTSDDDEP